MKKGRPGQDGVPAVPAKRRSLVLRRLMFSELPRWKCWCYRAALGIPLFLVLLLAVLTQTVLLKRLVLPPLESALGVRIEAEWVYVGRGGDLVMRGVRVRDPAVAGPAGTMVQIGGLRADVDWWSVVRGRPRLSEVRLVDPLVRLSQSVDDETLNVASLFRAAGGTAAGPIAPMELPRIVGTRIALELGEHHAQTYTILKRLNLEGTLVPMAGGGNRRYDIRLHETSPRRGRPGVTLSGRIDDADLDVEMTGLVLDEWPADAIPSPARERFRELDLKGDVVSTRFLAREGKWTLVRLELADIAVNLPLKVEPESGARPTALPLMRMSGVSGDIEFTPAGVAADLNGRIEDLPYSVTLRFDGLSIDSAFRMDIVSENFQIARNPDLLPYAPHLVRKRFRSFSSPTGEVDTRMTVTRGPPTPEGPAPIRVAGLVNFSHVDAAYDRFPYRFPDLSGVVRFDDEGVDLVQITGTAPSGAKLLASGRIAPLGTDAGVNLDIDVTNMPLDERVQAALGGERGRLIPALFSREKYQALIDSGLVFAPDHAAALQHELGRLRNSGADPARAAVLERQLQVPVFAFGGIGRVHVNLNRPIGEDSDWFTTIDVGIPQAGLLVDDFPLPILASGVALHVDDDRADLVAGTFRPLSGGLAEVSLAALLHDPATGEKDFRPDVHVTARDVPVDALFLSALPRGADGQHGGGLVQEILGGLGVAGLVDATAHIVHRPSGPLGFDVHVDLAHTELAPPPGEAAAPLRVTGLTGTADVSESRLDLDLEGSLRMGAMSPGEPERAGGRMGVRALVQYGGEGPQRHWSYDTTLTGTAVDASAPVQDLIRPFSESTAAAMASRRAELRPSGTLDASTRVTGSSSSPVRAQTTITRAENIGLDAIGARAGLTNIQGTTIFSLGAERGVVAQFSALRADLSFDGESAGTLSLDGAYDFGGGPETDLAAAIDGGRFESALTRRMVPRILGESAAAWWAAATPSGAYDQRLRVLSDAAGVQKFSGEMLPRSFTFLAREPAGSPALIGPPLQISLPKVDGAIRFDPDGGQVVGLEAQSAQWSASAEGRWTIFGPGEFSAGGSAALNAQSLSPDLRAMLPQALRDAFAALSLRAAGPLSVEDARFSIAHRRSAPPAADGAPDPAPAPVRTADYSGLVRFEDVSLEAGLKVSGLDGSMEFEAVQAPDAGPMQYGLKVWGSNLTAAGVRMTDARARILSGREEGSILVPLISARCHGGRVVAQGHTWTSARSEADAAPTARLYEASAQWSGVRFSPAMADLANAMNASPAAPPPPEDDLSRGLFEGELSIAGTVDDEESRRGRGTMRIAGGRVLKFPLVLQLIEVSNLAPPINAALDFARVSLLIDGPLITFEDVSIFSSAVSILGYGTMTWPATDLDLRFRSRAARQIPIISQLVEGLRDELVGTAVKGTLAHPVVSLKQFPETRRFISRAIGRSPGAEERQMEDIQRRSRSADAPPAPGAADPVRPSGPGGPP